MGQVKRFQNRTWLTKISLAANIAEANFMPNSPMMLELRAKNDWLYWPATGEKVYQQILNCNRTVEVYTYRPFNCKTRAVAKFDGKAVHLNSYKLGKLTLRELAATLSHEYLHACGFTHGNNWKTQKKINHSVPYYVSENYWRWL